MQQFMNYKKLMSDLDGMDSPVVRWGVLVVGFILFWTLLFEPFLSWKETQLDLLAKRSVEVSKLKGLKASQDGWQKAMLLYQDSFSKVAEYFFQEGAVVSQGKIQQIIANITKKHHLTIVVQKAYEAEAEPALGMRLPVSFTLQGAVDDAIHFIVDIASYPKIFVVDELRVNRQGDRTVTLTVRLNGYVLEAQNE